MSCCEGIGNIERFPGTGCCGSSCVSTAENKDCLASEPRIRSCLCQGNVGCLDRADCGGFRPSGSAATGACPGPCQCAEEEAWNCNVPPKPNCEWLNNFTELRRQWSDHGRQQNCKCCNCRPCRTVTPCRQCPSTSKISRTTLPSTNCKKCCEDNRLSDGAYNYYANSLTLDLEENESAMANRESDGGCKYEENYGCGFAGGCRSSQCQPCGPSPKSILKKRSCCQCITGYCMCQPTPRSCNCPPPVQVDARADRECSCDCPSSPECACPPSERRFPRAKIKCPNARLCCPLPRLPPGPKCQCVQCQPCLPPPCDPCTSSKCCTKLSRANPRRPSSPCRPTSPPCRPKSPSFANSPFPPCRPAAAPPACASCRKVARPCGECEEANYGPPYARTANQSQTLSRPTSPVCKGTGQSVSPWITINESTGDVGGCEGMLLINERQEGLQPSHRSCDAKDQCHRNCRSHCSAAREIIERVDFDEEGASDARDSSLSLTRNREGRSLGTEEPGSVSSNATAQTLKSGVNVSFQVRSKERARNVRSRETSPKRLPDSRTRSSSPTRVAATSTDKEQSNPKAAIVRARSPLDARRRQTATQAYFPFRSNLQIQRNALDREDRNS